MSRCHPGRSERQSTRARGSAYLGGLGWASVVDEFLDELQTLSLVSVVQSDWPTEELVIVGADILIS